MHAMIYIIRLSMLFPFCILSNALWLTGFFPFPRSGLLRTL
jgi:hypothetical protein